MIVELDADESIGRRGERGMSGILQDCGKDVCQTDENGVLDDSQGCVIEIAGRQCVIAHRGPRSSLCGMHNCRAYDLPILVRGVQC